MGNEGRTGMLVRLSRIDGKREVKVQPPRLKDPDFANALRALARDARFAQVNRAALRL